MIWSPGPGASSLVKVRSFREKRVTGGSWRLRRFRSGRIHVLRGLLPRSSFVLGPESRWS